MVRVLRVAVLFGLAALLVVPTIQAQDEKKAEEKKADEKKVAKLDFDSLFKKLDTDSDGNLSPSEFKKFADLPEVKEKLNADPKAALKNLLKGGGNFDLEKLKEKITPEQLEKLKERFGGNFDLEKLKEKLEKRKNKAK